MYENFYLVWGILPLAFLLLVAWSVVKRASRVHGAEDLRSHLSQLVFSSFGLALAILIDQSFLADGPEFVVFQSIDIRVLRWLSYPAVLFCLAWIQGKIVPDKYAGYTYGVARYNR